MNEIFGFKASHGGKHVLIAGHARTQYGNIEFSGVLDSTNLDTLTQSLTSLQNSIYGIKTIANCYHSNTSVIDRETSLIKCNQCQFEWTCRHDSWSQVWTGDTIDLTKGKCTRCEKILELDPATNRPVTPAFRSGQGTS